ncbi:DNA-binding protein [Lysinibacillus sp. FSL L8-0126]|uniref:DNA-binding protein n=1 Tax=Lysinibacillus sp. FSL L8-0126 TaxID=2921515 RepID=UPI003159F4BC
MNENMQINEVNMEKLISTVVIKTTSSLKNSLIESEWMSLKKTAKYANVSYNTLMKFRLMGLEISGIDGVKRVSKKRN